MKQVFLSYARSDIRKAVRLYDDLRRATGIRIWFDQKDLWPGVKWGPAIRKAIRESDYFLAVLSRNSVSTRGFRHTELREALEVAKEFPEDWIYLVPARLDDCPMPLPELQELNYTDLFPKWTEGIAKLSRLLRNNRDSELVSVGGALAAADPGKVQAGGVERKRRRKARHSNTRRLRFHYKVGIANLDENINDSMVGRVARGLNRVQPIFHLATKRLVAPPGALATIKGSPQLYIPHLPRDFYARIGPLDMDSVICVTKLLLTFEEGDSMLYNYLAGASPIDPRVRFVSCGGLDEYARAAGVALEVAIANRITAELANFFLDLGYHYEKRNCLMDFTEDHSDLAGVLRAGCFCSYCSEELKTGISRPFAEAFRAMIAWGR